MKSGIRDFIRHLRQEQKPPEIQGERCVHAIIETAHCRACVDVCPQGAWSLDDTALSLNQEACDGCELCVSACPTGALARARTLQWSARVYPHRAVVFLACEMAMVGTPDPDVRIPCVHSLGLQDVLLLLRLDIQELVATTADCNQCYRGAAPRLQNRLVPLNRSLTGAGLTGLGLQLCSASAWERQRQSGSPAIPGTQLSRRGFFRKLSQGGLRLAGLEEVTETAAQPPGRLFPVSNRLTKWPYVPSIDVQRCSGCDACVRLCPQHALTVSHTLLAYRIEAQQCNGCRVCVDVCEQRAVTLRHWQAQRQDEVPLRVLRCRACGVSFHMPAEQEQARQPFCQVCARHNHHRHLYQVLE